MRFTKLKISADAESRLRSLRQRTGLTPNLLCRMAIMLSLEEGPVGSGTDTDEGGSEFNAYTLTGDHNRLIFAMLRLVEEEQAGGRVADDELLARLRAHIHRGVGTLSVRAKAPADVALLAAAA
ncbi:DNA sulfur modification protein DndE [Sphingomonas sp. RHCKR7]|uniref:DNA sulfur modification protein DndE n=1 Tax=Sphingomonas folli TaxID=2862497 RepID=UPI001CA4774E|nr:DNA sulfur modification protein DndE [Sphingomonas folli]MBW6528966.1 DNA sulfur modification protein DndE [Sphingomonas folli]